MSLLLMTLILSMHGSNMKITGRVTLCPVQRFVIGRKWILKYYSVELQIQNNQPLLYT